MLLLVTIDGYLIVDCCRGFLTERVVSMHHYSSSLHIVLSTADSPSYLGRMSFPLKNMVDSVSRRTCRPCACSALDWWTDHQCPTLLWSVFACGACATNEQLQHVFARHLSGVPLTTSCGGTFSPDVDEIVIVARCGSCPVKGLPTIPGSFGVLRACMDTAFRLLSETIVSSKDLLCMRFHNRVVCSLGPCMARMN